MFLPGAVLLAALLIAFSFLSFAHANPFYTGTKAQSATATTTVSYLTPGTATSTTVYDSYEQYGTNQPNSGNLTIPDTVAIVLDGSASSTATTLTATCEFSDNYNGTTKNGDWYQNEILPATTSNTFIAQPLTYSFTYASSTVGGVANTPRFQKLVTCPIPTRFVRVVVTDTGAPASLWTEIIPTKERN